MRLFYPADPIEDHLAALRLLEGVADGVDAVVPGHSSVGGPDQVKARIDQDRAYVLALRNGQAHRQQPAERPIAHRRQESVIVCGAGRLHQLSRRSAWPSASIRIFVPFGLDHPRVRRSGEMAGMRSVRPGVLRREAMAGPYLPSRGRLG
ncbi:hypothetical protein ACWDR1_29260 [Streptosporangium sandarakinum]